MNTVTLRGASDDLIEVEGAIEEEFYPFHHFEDGDDDGAYLAFSEGTVLRIIYDSHGKWRINRVAKGTANYLLDELEVLDGEYSDKATLTGDIRWVAQAKAWASRASRSPE